MEMLKLMGEEQDSTQGGEDFISELPDAILSYILSWLTMKDEVRMSVLSSRWRYLWASYRLNLAFDPHTMLGRGFPEKGVRDVEGLRVLNSKFASLVGKVLQLYHAPRIHCMEVAYCFDKGTSSHLGRWIEFAVARGVEVLDIILLSMNEASLLYPPYVGNSELYTFPRWLISNGKTSSLKHLYLRLCNLECPPAFNGFNTLVTIDLQHVKLNESCLETFFSSCVLEDLIMRSCSLPAILKVTGTNNGPCVNLRCLEVLRCFGVTKMLVSAPKLMSFMYTGSMVCFLLNKVQQLHDLFIRFESTILDSSEAEAASVVTNLPDDTPHLECLFLQLTTEMTVLPAKLSSYVNLKKLELEVFSCASEDFLWIGSTINVLPLLSKLHVMLCPESHMAREGARMMSTSGSPHNQLKEVLISGFVPFFYQTELVIYLLKNCVALERMTIDPELLMYDMNWDLKPFDDSCIWRKENREQERFYELMHREVPERAGLVTIL